MTVTNADDARRFELAELERWAERPLRWLGLVWLALLVTELLSGLPRTLSVISTAIWIIFVVDFLVRLALAPEKGAYLKKNWLTAVSVLLPALRIVRAFAALGAFARMLSSLRLVRLVAAVNRAMRSLGGIRARRRFVYATTLTCLVIVTGAAGMYAFERGVDDPRGLHDFSSALWWTAMLVITIGTDYWPRSPEGRILSFLLALYGFAVLGFITATLASYFLGEREAPAR
jgi:voltage-gated potassium channel